MAWAATSLARRPSRKRLISFAACLWAARRYYDAWLWRHGRRCWEIARAHPVYGEQWRAVGPGAIPGRAG